VTHLELPVALPGLLAPERLRAVTIELEPDTAAQLLPRAVALSSSWSRGLARRPDSAAGAIARLRPHGAVIESNQRTIVGLGIAAHLGVRAYGRDPTGARRVAAKLASVSCEDPIHRMASSVMALGALAFDPAATALLVIPQVAVVADTDGLCWATVAAHAGSATGDIRAFARSVIEDICSAEDTSSREVGYLELTDTGEPAFTRGVESALEEIGTGRISKVVLARRAVASLGRPVDVRATLERLLRRESASALFAFTSRGHAFVGATPELLVARDGRVVRSLPLAGSVRTSGETGPDEEAIAEMAASAKENFEHRVVVDAVATELSKHCSTLSVPRDPEVLRLRQISHLATSITGELRHDPPQGPSVLELAAWLHPTPAVGGAPSEAAVALIRSLEPDGRGRYAGPVGWMDSSGDGEFFIGIRSAEIYGDRAVLYAGAGIVAGSDPRVELDETSLKLETMLGALTSS
jgi:menaquinone-specific isochorismate synthase